MNSSDLSAVQCRMARAALKLEIRELASLADVSPNTIVRLERGERLHDRTLSFIKGIFEAEGIAFIDDGAASAVGGIGIRLRGGERKSRYGQLFELIGDLPDLRHAPDAAFQALIAVIEHYLGIVESEQRELDNWERFDFNDALNALNRSDVFSASAYVWHAITPPDNQSPEYPLSAEMIVSVIELNLSYFRTCLDQLKVRGYRPRFGGMH